MIDNKKNPTAYIVIYKLITLWFLDYNRRMWVSLLPCHWHILPIPLEAGRDISTETCRLADVFPPDDLGCGPYTQFII